MRRLSVVLLLIIGVSSLLVGCDQSVQPTPLANAKGEAIRYTPTGYNRNEPSVTDEFALNAVDAQGNSRAIATLKEPNTDAGQGIYLHIFAYGSGKLARFIPASPDSSLAHGLAIGEPAQIEVVDLNSGETNRYQALPDVDPNRSNAYWTTPFSTDGTQLVVPGYYLLNLNTTRITAIPNLDALFIIGWSAADGLIYAHVLKRTTSDVVSQVSPKGQQQMLNLPQRGDDIYNETLSPDGKQLYYETITSTQVLPPLDPSNLGVPEMNVIERYDVASGSSTAIVRAAVGDYFSVGSGNFTLSTDGRSLAYVESRPTATGAEQPGAAVIWRVDITGSSQPVKIIGGLNSPFRLHWCNNSLYYYDGEAGWTGWYGLPIEGGKPTRIAGEILGCAP